MVDQGCRINNDLRVRGRNWGEWESRWLVLAGAGIAISLMTRRVECGWFKLPCGDSVGKRREEGNEPAAAAGRFFVSG